MQPAHSPKDDARESRGAISALFDWLLKQKAEAKEQPVILRPIETGHFPQREEPARLASMIRQFVDVDWQTP